MHVCLSIYPSFYICICLPTYLPTYLPTHLSVCLSVCLSLSLSLTLSHTHTFSLSLYSWRLFLSDLPYIIFLVFLINQHPNALQTQTCTWHTITLMSLSDVKRSAIGFTIMTTLWIIWCIIFQSSYRTWASSLLVVRVADENW